MEKHPNTGANSLELNLVVKNPTVRLGEPISTTISLTNIGFNPVIVNARFSMGYPDTFERDLYCEIFREDGKQYQGYKAFQVDYRSLELTPELFPSLKPGESLHVVYDLQEWYRITEPGMYTIRVIYDPETHPEFEETGSTPIASLPVTVTVKA